MTSASSMHETGHSKLVHWDNPQGWGRSGEGVQDGGRHVQPWLIHVNLWQKPPQHCKVISLQLKLKTYSIHVKHICVRAKSVLSKTSIRHLVYARTSLILGHIWSSPNIHKCIWSMPKAPWNLVLPKMSTSVFHPCQMVLDKTTYQEPFGMY